MEYATSPGEDPDHGAVGTSGAARWTPRGWSPVGVQGVVVLGFVLCAVGRALLIPLFGSADEANHLDYAYQLWRGSWPDFFEGPVIPGSGPKTSLSVQAVSQHPPLFYLLMAPLAGPLTDSAGVLAAGLVARAANVLVGAVAVAMVGYAARAAFPTNPLLGPVATLIAALCCSMLGVSGAVYNDTLATALMASCIALTCRFIRLGPSPRRWLLLAAACCAALLTRLSLAVVVLVCLIAVAAEGMGRGARRDHWGRWTGPAKAAAIGVLILISSGWFYLRNLRLTGTITGGHPDWAAEHLNAVHVSLGELASQADTWQRLLSLFVPVPALGGIGLLLIGVPAVGGIGTAVVALTRGRATRTDAIVIGLLTIEAALIVAMQLKYSAGGGGLHPRYLLPALVSFAVVMGAGLTSSRPLAGVVTGAWFAAWAALFVPWWWQQAQQATTVGADFPAWPMAATTLLGAALAAWAYAVLLIGRLGMRTMTGRRPSEATVAG